MKEKEREGEKETKKKGECLIYLIDNIIE